MQKLLLDFLQPVAQLGSFKIKFNPPKPSLWFHSGRLEAVSEDTHLTCKPLLPFNTK